jgi:hypothetical protein
LAATDVISSKNASLTGATCMPAISLDLGPLYLLHDGAHFQAS